MTKVGSYKTMIFLLTLILIVGLLTYPGDVANLTFIIVFIGLVFIFESVIQKLQRNGRIVVTLILITLSITTYFYI
ncbi:hypothetical protein ABEY52_22095 [Priestia aryabhattai]|uniref:hypothetical protein n=1 Tax=Priestia aryabhattai TaxID=412384 RepID=UPI003D2D4C4F